MAALVDNSSAEQTDRIGRKLAPFNPTNDDAIEVAFSYVLVNFVSIFRAPCQLYPRELYATFVGC
jgi:hypothetical protein